MFEIFKEKMHKQRIDSKIKKILKDATGGNYIGTYEFQDDRIICHVDGKLLKKHMQEKEFLQEYKLVLGGLYRTEDETSINICTNCGLKKPIYYIIDGVKFDSHVETFSRDDAHILFRNCTFKKTIKINYGNDIIFENNKYVYFYPIRAYGIFLSCDEPINNLKIINDNFAYMYEHNFATFGMKIKANNVEIKNTIIEGTKLSLLDLECNNLVIENSNINCNEINIFSKNIELKDNTIQANNGFIMDEDTMYMDFDQKTKEKEELESARANLINTLRILRDKCNQDIEKEINEGINKLDKKSTKLKNKKMKKFFK